MSIVWLERGCKPYLVEPVCYIWTFNWLWLLTLAGRQRYWSLLLLSPWNEASGCIFARCIALTPSLPLVAGFTIQRLFNSVVMLVSKYKRGKFLEIQLCLAPAQDPIQTFWVGEAEGTTDVSWHHLPVVHDSPLYSIEYVPSQTTYIVRLLDYLG